MDTNPTTRPTLNQRAEHLLWLTTAVAVVLAPIAYVMSSIADHATVVLCTGLFTSMIGSIVTHKR